MKSKFNDGAVLQNGEFLECLRELFEDAPGPLVGKYVVFTKNDTGVSYLTRVINCGGHQNALTRAMQECARNGRSANVTHWVVVGSCQDPKCDCGGKLRTVEFLTSTEN
jgi:hypothetical protein